jgi:predicted Zn-dependent protease with MMP-like domain
MQKAEAEACTNQMLGYLPDELAETIGDLTIYVAADRQDLEVLRAAVKESGQGRVAIPQNFRAVYLGTPLDPAVDDESDDVELPKGVIVLNASMLRNEQDVLDTLLHEIGHALGYDEDEIAALGLE